MKNGYLFLLIATAICWSACTKSGAADTPADPSAILGKWNRINNIVRSTPVAGGTAYIDTTVFQPGSYSDFRSDGNVYTYNVFISGSPDYDTTPYKVLDNTRMLVGVKSSSGTRFDTATTTISGSKLTLYLKEIETSSIDENWSNFSK